MKPHCSPGTSSRRSSFPCTTTCGHRKDFGPGATLDPLEFAATFSKLGGTSEVRILDVGEIAIFSK